MIRDEFKNVDRKTLDKKAKAAKSNVNEREYYAKKMSQINDLFTPVKFTTIFCLVCFLILAALYVACMILDKDFKVQWHCVLVLTLASALTVWAIVWFAFAGLLVVWTVVWFAFLCPHLKRKAAFYKSELERLSREYVLKRTGRS